MLIQTIEARTLLPFWRMDAEGMNPVQSMDFRPTPRLGSAVLYCTMTGSVLVATSQPVLDANPATRKTEVGIDMGWQPQGLVGNGKSQVQQSIPSRCCQQYKRWKWKSEKGSSTKGDNQVKQERGGEREARNAPMVVTIGKQVHNYSGTILSPRSTSEPIQ